MTPGQIHAPADTERLTVKPSEIRSGDWLRDLGRLRQVGAVEPVGDGTSQAAHGAQPINLYVIRFTDEPDGDFSTMGLWEEFSVTIWRVPVHG